MNEQAVTITLAGQQMMGIIHQADYEYAEYNSDIAVIIVVGGPQYRVGSHRQFVQLSRKLAKQGITCMRFDYRGMGDSEGDKQTFENIDQDIKAAIDVLQKVKPEIKQIVLWGLCDAASAALMYGWQDTRVCAMVLLNPWLRNKQAMGQAMVKYYYVQRLLSCSFWRKLLTGKIHISQSALEAKGFLQNSVSTVQDINESYQDRMNDGLNRFNGQILSILSGNDLTAREFEQQINSNKRKWEKLSAHHCKIVRLPQADHTFSSGRYKREVEIETYQFVLSVINKQYN